MPNRFARSHRGKPDFGVRRPASSRALTTKRDRRLSPRPTPSTNNAAPPRSESRLRGRSPAFGGRLFARCLPMIFRKPANPNRRHSPNPRTPGSKHLQRLHARPTLFDFLAAHNTSQVVMVQGARKSKKCSAALRADAGDAISHSFLGLGKDGSRSLVRGCETDESEFQCVCP